MNDKYMCINTHRYLLCIHLHIFTKLQNDTDLSYIPMYIKFYSKVRNAILHKHMTCTADVNSTGHPLNQKLNLPHDQLPAIDR